MMARYLLFIMAMLLGTGAFAGDGAALGVRHIHLRVADVERTKVFYRDKLGLEVTGERPGEKVEFQGGKLWFGVWRGDGPVPVTPAVVIGLEAQSVTAVYEKLKRLGVNVPKPPEHEDYGWSFRLADPDGYSIEIEGGE